RSRGELRVARLVEARLREADGEALDLLVVADREGGDGGGGDAAAQEDADGHVRDHAARDRGVEQADELLADLARVPTRAPRGRGELPVAAHPEAALVEH